MGAFVFFNLNFTVNEMTFSEMLPGVLSVKGRRQLLQIAGRRRQRQRQL